VSAALHGVMERALQEELEAGCELTALTAEFGTFEPARVFWAMRADNWLHQHGDPASGLAEEIRREIRTVFCPQDPSWRRAVLGRGAQVLEQVQRGLLQQPAQMPEEPDREASAPGRR